MVCATIHIAFLQIASELDLVGADIDRFAEGSSNSQLVEFTLCAHGFVYKALPRVVHNTRFVHGRSQRLMPTLQASYSSAVG